MPIMLAFAAAALLSAQQPRPYENPAWTEAIAPFRIADRVYYVGSRDLGAYLIDGGTGLILVDAGVPEFAPTLLANVRALGFDPKRIRLILGTQAHLDHAGGLAAVKAASGARMLASEGDAPLFERGGRDDFAWGDDMAYPPVKVEGLVRDGQRVRIGTAILTAHITPGHTKGCTTWTFPVRERGRIYTAQINCSTSVPGYRLLGTPAYPNMVRDYERSFAKLKHIPCDIFLAAHGSSFNLDGKRARIGQGSTNPFVDPQGCRRMLANSEAAFRQQLAREQIRARGKGKAGTD